jgi:hypothetical protein
MAPQTCGPLCSGVGTPSLVRRPRNRQRLRKTPKTPRLEKDRRDDERFFRIFGKNALAFGIYIGEWFALPALVPRKHEDRNGYPYGAQKLSPPTPNSVLFPYRNGSGFPDLEHP